MFYWERIIFVGMKHFIILLFFLITPNDNVLSGVVMDGNDNSPLHYSNIKILETGMVTTSDIFGRYVFPPLNDGDYTLVHTFIGYTPDTVLVHLSKNKSTFVKITLYPTTISESEMNELLKNQP